jgi:hypothetical protein
MCTLIILPGDSTIDSDPSSSALAVKQFSKIQRPRKTYSMSFDFVYIGLYNDNDIVFFDAWQRPPSSIAALTYAKTDKMIQLKRTTHAKNVGWGKVGP